MFEICALVSVISLSVVLIIIGIGVDIGGSVTECLEFVEVSISAAGDVAVLFTSVLLTAVLTKAVAEVVLSGVVTSGVIVVTLLNDSDARVMSNVLDGVDEFSAFWKSGGSVSCSPVAPVIYYRTIIYF